MQMADVLGNSLGLRLFVFISPSGFPLFGGEVEGGCSGCRGSGGEKDAAEMPVSRQFFFFFFFYLLGGGEPSIGS